MISPGTNNLRATSISAPARTTVAVLLTIACSFSAALSARISWKKRSTTPSSTMTKITTVARRSPVRNDSTPNATSRVTNGFLRLSPRRRRGDWRFSRAISFSPYCFRRESASVAFKPSMRDPSSFRTASISARAFSNSLSESFVSFPMAGLPGRREISTVVGVNPMPHSAIFAAIPSRDISQTAPLPWGLAYLAGRFWSPSAGRPRPSTPGRRPRPRADPSVCSNPESLSGAPTRSCR